MVSLVKSAHEHDPNALSQLGVPDLSAVGGSSTVDDKPSLSEMVKNIEGRATQELTCYVRVFLMRTGFM